MGSFASLYRFDVLKTDINMMYAGQEGMSTQSRRGEPGSSQHGTTVWGAPTVSQRKTPHYIGLMHS